MTKNIYLRKLDYIRIVSCILVFLYHLNILKGGYLAVCTFFVMSGFLSTKSFLKEDKFSLSKYFLNRLKRIYLPLLIVTFGVIILAQNFQILSWLNLKQESLSVIGGYNNFWQLNANLDYFTKHINSPFMHFWYIAILIQIDICFPFLAILLKKLDEKINKYFSTVIVLLAVIISTAFFIYMGYSKDIMFVYYNTFLRCFSFFYGVMAALIIYKHNIKLPKTLEKYHSIIFLIYLIGLIALSVLTTANSIYYPIFMLLATIISSRLLRYSYIESAKNKVLDYICKFFASISYEVYLIQYPVIYMVQILLQNNKYGVLITIALTFILSCILHILTNTKLKYKFVKAIQIAIISFILIIGSYYLVMAKDYSIEMKELEESLNENLKLVDSLKENFLAEKEKSGEYSGEPSGDYNRDLSGENVVISDNTIESDSNVKNIEEIVAKDEEVQKEPSSGEIAIMEYVKTLPVVGVGDSVLLGATPKLLEYFPNGYFDGKVSRTILGGQEVLSELEAEGKLGNIVICALANNGDYITKRNKNFMEFIGDREVFWVDAVLADVPEFNAQFEEFAKDYPNLHIIHWEEASKDHPEYFYADGIHLKSPGMKAYAKVIFDAICDYYINADIEAKSGEYNKY